MQTVQGALQGDGVADIELFQFHSSHFNEKVRWTLDLKRVPHSRTALIPGPHMLQMMKLTRQSQTPALRVGSDVIAGSTTIIDRLEQDFPEPRLYPEDPDERSRALSIVREFDDEVGPAVRLAKFFEVLDASVAIGAFCWDRSPLVKAIYRAGFPAIRRVMWSKMGITEETAERGLERTQQAFDFVAKESGSAGYLVGDRFSVADLTCASLLMPAVRVEAWGGPAEVSTPKVNHWLDRWVDHPGAEWVREIFRRHRRV